MESVSGAARLQRSRPRRSFVARLTTGRKLQRALAELRAKVEHTCLAVALHGFAARELVGGDDALSLGGGERRAATLQQFVEPGGFDRKFAEPRLGFRALTRKVAEAAA